MSVLRLVVVADGLDATRLCEVLIAAGVTPANIHVSSGPSAPWHEELGIKNDLPVGRLVICSEEELARTEHAQARRASIDHLVP